MPVGKQDQYAAAFGGLNYIAFSRHGVTVDRLHVSDETLEALERGLMLFFTGRAPRPAAILHRQGQAARREDPATIRRLEAIKALGLQIRVALECGDLGSFADLLHCSWMEKRQLTQGVTTPFLDQCYETARENGALGGKIAGAGGGGFLVLYCPEERQEAVTGALSELGLQRWPLALEDTGVQVMRAAHWAPRQASVVFTAVSEAMEGELL